jgi:phage/plasmid-like protein (TIGR03299 family)
MSTLQEIAARFDQMVDLRASRPEWDRYEYGDGMVESAMSAGGRSLWHGIGNIIEKPALTAAEVLDDNPLLASEVIKRPLRAVVPAAGRALTADRDAGEVYDDAGEPSLLVPVPRHYATVREVDGKVLGVVGERYTVLQNRDALTAMDDLVDSGDAKYVTAGTLRGGAHVWLCAQLPIGVKVAGLDGELVEIFIVLSNSHDGRGSVTWMVTPVRVECWNTLRFALASAPRNLHLRHTSSVHGRTSEIRHALGITFDYVEQLALAGEELIEAPWSEADLEQWLAELAPVPKGERALNKAGDGPSRAARNAEDLREAVEAIYRNAPDLEPVRGTAWAAVQAAVAYHDHEKAFRDQGEGADDNRFYSITYGRNLGTRAFDLAAGRALGLDRARQLVAA